jgi:hypothetical protein
MKYRAYANASGDNVSANQNSFVNAAVGGNAFLNNYHACAGIEVMAMPGALTFIADPGDSLQAGYGTNTTVNPMGYSPGAIAASRLSASGRPTLYMNLGCAGKGAAYFNRFFRDRLADPEFRPSHVFLPGWTVNDGQTESGMQGGIAQSIESARQAKAAQVRHVFLMTATGFNGDGAGTIATRLRNNALLRDQAALAGIPIHDRERLLTDPVTNLIRAEYVAADNLHYSRAGNVADGEARVRLIQQYQ